MYFEYTLHVFFQCILVLFRSLSVPLCLLNIQFFFSRFVLLRTITLLIIKKEYSHFLTQWIIPLEPSLKNFVFFCILSESPPTWKKSEIFPLFDFSDSSWCILVILCGKLYISIVLPWFRLDLKFTFFLYLVGVSAT